MADELTPSPDARSASAGWRWRLFFAIAGAMLVLFAAAAWIGNFAIERAHRGDGFELLQRAMDARHEHPASFYKAKFLRLGVMMLAAVLAASAMVLVTTSPWFFRRFVGGATAQSLAFIRIVVCAILFVDAITIDLGQAAIFPLDVRLPMGVCHVLSQLPLGYDRLNSSATLLRLWQALTAAFLLLSLLGWRTRVVLPLAVVFYMIQGGIIRQYDRLFHTGLTPLYVLAVLSVLPCANAWSLDRLRRIKRGLPVPPDDVKLAVYGWGRYLCWLPVVILYVEAGLTKLVRVGPHWWHASNMRAIFIRDSIERAELRWVFIPQIVGVPDYVFDAIGILTLVVEIGFWLVLFSAVARVVLPTLMALMHIGIFAFQGIRFFDLLFLQLIFFDGPAVVARVRRWFIRRPVEPRRDEPHVDPAFATRRRWAYPLAGCAIVLVMLGVWARQIEFYPFSSMNLYASFNSTSVVNHYRVIAHRPDGRRERIYLQQVVDLLQRTNFRQAIARGFKPEAHPEGRLARRYLRAIAAAYNRANPHEPIAAIEVEHWRWDYRAEPDPVGKDFGRVVDRYVVPIMPIADVETTG